ncbi:MAG: S24/S26 family peptidase [Acutalibacteraceae bacterium]|nr:S24/S26 family peptidase [Acutalibacteraceae bacterium]
MSKKVSMDDMAPLIRETLAESGEVSFVSAGVSMLPTIRDRKDTVTLVRPQGKLRKGDVPFYQRDNGQYILHRVIYVNGDTYVMRGDNQWENEYNIRHDQIIGVLYSFDRNGKTHKVTDAGYKIYVKFLPVIRYIRKYYYLFKSKVYAFIKFLTGDRFPRAK